MDFMGESDAFVKVFLLPQLEINKVSTNSFKSSCISFVKVLKTKVVEWSVNPVFNETFRFQVAMDMIKYFLQRMKMTFR